ncbi:MAG: urate hydroxylase PuuD [Kofleriaceae bacterium]
MSLNDLLDVLFRWAHLIAGIMWIGNSMLFNWLDRNLVKRAEDAELSQGRIFMVHSGAFYEVEKKLLAPGEMPSQLHWFKWQNGFTWLTGISLLIVVYYGNGAAFLVDPSVRELAPAAAIALSAGSLVLAWLVYDALWHTLGARHGGLATVISLAGLFGAAWAFTQVFSGRAAYIQTGVLMGTMMTGNVWLRIMPAQAELIASTTSGKPQDPVLSQRAKQRSIHNNYLTFPLLFIMLSNHFPATYGHHLGWLALFVVMVGGAGVRHFMNVRYQGQLWLVPALVTGALCLGGLMVITHLRAAPAVTITEPVPFARAQEIIVQRCVPCHSARPSDSLFLVPPGNVVFDTTEQIRAMVPRISARAVEQRTMPFLNRTEMTVTERAELGAWISAGAKVQ